MTLLKSIQRAAQPTLLKAAMVGSVLLLPAIVSRIQKTVTVPAPRVTPAGVERLAPPSAVWQAVDAPPEVIAPAATKPAPGKGTKSRKARVAVTKAPLIVAAPLVANAVETESPVVALAVKPAPPVKKGLDTQADFAQLVPKNRNPPPTDSTEVVVASHETKEAEEKNSSDNSEENWDDLDDASDTTVGATPEEKRIDELLAEDHAGSEAVEAMKATVAAEPLDIDTEVTTAQLEGEIIATDVTTYEANLAQWTIAAKANHEELLAALGAEAPQPKGVTAPAHAAEIKSEVAETSVERSAGPQLVTPVGEPVLVAPSHPKEILSATKVTYPTLATEAEEKPEAEVAPEMLAAEPAPTYEVGKISKEAKETKEEALPPFDVPVVAVKETVAAAPAEIPAEPVAALKPIAVAEPVVAEKPIAVAKPAVEPEPSWAKYRQNEKDEGDEDGPTLVNPSLSLAGQLAEMAIQPKVSTQLAGFVPAPTLVDPSRSGSATPSRFHSGSPSRPVSRTAIAQTEEEEPASAPSSGRVLDTAGDLAALTQASPKPVVVAAVTSPASSTDAVRAASPALPQLTQRRLVPVAHRRSGSIAAVAARADADSEEDDSQATAEEAGELEVEHDDGGEGFGQLEIEPALDGWLDKNKGHVELSLVPVRGRNPNDAIHLDPDQFNFPDPEFQFTTEGLKGKYRLMAEFFMEGTTDVVAKIAYPEKITADSYKRKVGFRLGFRDFQRARFLRNNKARGLSMTLTVFEGASGNYRYPRAITRRQNARVAIEGFPELGLFKANRRGNVVIPRVPSHSTLRLHVMADGFYDTHVTVPTGSSPVYAPVFLVSRDQVAAVTKHFTKHPQAANKGVVLGRVFNPKTRTPLAGEEFTLQYRKGQTVYFYSLPDLELKETSNTGLFGFFNVSSSPRGLKRASKTFPYFLDVAPNSAVYLELGRGGEKNLRGQIRNPFHPEIPQGTIRLAGADKDEEIYSNHRGGFEMDGLDFPTGTVRVEMEVEGMLTYLYDVPWNPRERVTTNYFSVFDKESIESSVKSHGKQNWKSNLGTVIGGTPPEFFKGRNECVTVTLESLSGRTLDEKIGPFLMGPGDSGKTEKLCLNSSKTRVTFVNLAQGAYLLKWRNAAGQTIRAREVNVELKKVSVAVD